MLTVAGKLKRAGLTGDGDPADACASSTGAAGRRSTSASSRASRYKSTIEADPETAIRTVPRSRAAAARRRARQSFRALAATCPTRRPSTSPAPPSPRTASRASTRPGSILVGAAGSGKTEALNATSRLDGVYLVGTLTEASLLERHAAEGHARRARAAGCCARSARAGSSSSRTSARSSRCTATQRAGVLAALREIYDGSWTRRRRRRRRPPAALGRPDRPARRRDDRARPAPRRDGAARRAVPALPARRRRRARAGPREPRPPRPRARDAAASSPTPSPACSPASTCDTRRRSRGRQRRGSSRWPSSSRAPARPSCATATGARSSSSPTAKRPAGSSARSRALLTGLRLIGVDEPRRGG